MLILSQFYKEDKIMNIQERKHVSAQLPIELVEWVKAKGKENYRSFTKELQCLLEESMQKDQANTQ